jgi:hypothetical protein
MSRGWRIGIGIVGALVAVELTLRLIGTVTGGTPGGPRSSSYATSRVGLAAYADLLGRAGHPIDQQQSLPHRTNLSPADTVVLLDPPAVARRDALALRAFVAAGGRLVAGGGDDDWLRALLRDPPRALIPGVRRAGAHGLGGTRSVVTVGDAAWASPGGTRPLVTGRGGIVVAVARIGRGRVYLLSDPSPLQNRLLGTADNAALGLALAGPPARPVEFLESYHGYGSSSGLAALPLSWKLLLGGLALAALVYVVARGRRLGPPEDEERELPPPRRAYVDSVAALLERTRRRDEAIEPVRRAAREAILRRSGLPADADDDAVQAAARRLGLGEPEAAALVVPVRTDADVLAVGRVLARIGQDHR